MEESCKQEKYIFLYQDGKSIRKIVEVEVPEGISGLIGIQRYTHFGEHDDHDLPTYEASGSYPLLTSGVFNPLYGKMMQLCDAMLADEKQREAFKGLVKDELSSWFNKNVSYTQKMSEQLFNK